MSIKHNLLPIVRHCFVALLLAAPLVVFAQHGEPQKVTIFGQEIGGALTIPACPKITKKIEGKKREVYASQYEIEATCYIGMAAQNTVMGILIPSNKRANYIKGTNSGDSFSVRMFVIDGVVQGIDFATFYSRSEEKDQLFRDLTDKFGEHTKTLPREWQNSNGAKYTRYEYDWATPNYLVSLYEKTIYNDAITGFVTIYTPKAATVIAAAEAENKKKADEERRKRNGGL